MSDNPHHSQRFVRRRPACHDTEWAPGTGLIWQAGECVFYDRPVNRFMRFRRSFDLESPACLAELRIFADTHYILYINGEYVGRGPGRSDPAWTRYDVHDVAARLKVGRNVVAVLCLFQGFGTGARISIMPGLLFHLTIETGSGQSITVVSDRSWKTSPASEYLRPTPRQHATLGCYEVWDGRLAEPGWTEENYDDSAWRPSDYMKSGLTNTPWHHWVARELPLWQENDVGAEGVSLVGEATLPVPAVPDIGAERPRPISRPPDSSAFPYLVAGCPHHAPALSRASVVTIDFGRVENGLLRLEVTATAGTVVDVLYAEFLEDGVVPRPHQARLLGDRFFLPGGRSRLAVAFNWKAFRYAQLWIWTPGQVTLHRAWLRTLYYPLPNVPGFHCDDPFLNRLDQISDRTMRLCMQDAYVDSSSREQQQWIGDGRRQAVINHHRWGDQALHRQLLEQIGQGQNWLGSLCPRHPAGNVNVSPIPAYCLDWVTAFEEYYWFTGDDSLATEWWPNIVHAMRWFTAYENTHGLLERVPHWMYLDVGGFGKRPGTGRINTALNLKYLEALRAATHMAARVGDAEAGTWYRGKATQLAAAIRTRLWDHTRGLYPDACTGGVFVPQHSEVTAALALLHLEAPGTPRAASILRHTFLEPDDDTVAGSPLAMLEVLSALAKHACSEAGLGLLRNRYREQLEMGTTSTWEHWQISSIAPNGYPVCGSASHAWGAAPIVFFTSNILGIRPLEPGWRRVAVAPHPSGLKQAAGAVQTPRGRIAVRWELHDGVMRLLVDVPADTKGAVRLPGGKEAPLSCGEYVHSWPT